MLLLLAAVSLVLITAKNALVPIIAQIVPLPTILTTIDALYVVFHTVSVANHQQHQTTALSVCPDITYLLTTNALLAANKTAKSAQAHKHVIHVPKDTT